MNNALSVIGTLSSYLIKTQNQDHGETVQKSLEAMDRQVKQALSLAEELKDFKDALTSDLSIRASMVPLGDFLRQFETAAKVLCGKKQVRFHLILNPQIPSDMTMDGKRVSQVLNNLLSNAIKFSPAGTGISLFVNSKDEHLACCLEDQGRGIPQSELHQIFKDPKSLTTLPTAHERSSGLGLAICQRIVEEHGGRIWADSHYGVGSRFCVSLPISGQIRGKNIEKVGTEFQTH